MEPFQKTLPIALLERKLMSPFDSLTEMALDLNTIRTIAVPSKNPLREVAADIVNYGYNLRYNGTEGGMTDIVNDEFDHLPTSQTFVAIGTYSDTPFALGTFRIITGLNLDVLQLFEMEEGQMWPHQRELVEPAEIGRFAIHPLLDSGLISNINPHLAKLVIQRKLWEHGMEILKQKKVELAYLILTMHILEFVKSSGIHPEKLEVTLPGKSEYSERLREKWPKYWKPDAPTDEQPSLYVAPKVLQPMSDPSESSM